jgi:leucine efflux protein
MNSSLYFSFLIASLVVLAIPGPSFAYAVAVGARATKKEIAFNAIGMGLGGLAITAALAFGASQLLEASPVAYTVLQMVGCIYLVYLGVTTFFASPKESVVHTNSAQSRSAVTPAFQGFVVETASPKSIIFYASLVPQFVDPLIGNVEFQFLILGVTFVALQVAWDVALMLGVSRIRAGAVNIVSAKAQRITNCVSGAIFVALGIALLFQERPRT